MGANRHPSTGLRYIQDGLWPGVERPILARQAAGQGRARGAPTAMQGERAMMRAILTALTLGLLMLAGPSAAEESAEGRGEPDFSVPTRAPGASGPGLDALLQLPNDYLRPSGRTVAGAGQSEWRRRFDRAHATLENLQSEMGETKEALDRASAGGGASQWAVASPGGGGANAGGAANSPLSFKLRQELVRKREAYDAAHRALRDLRIEADLAGVPAEWRGDKHVEAPKRLPDSPYYD